MTHKEELFVEDTDCHAWMMTWMMPVWRVPLLCIGSIVVAIAVTKGIEEPMRYLITGSAPNTPPDDQTRDLYKLEK